MNEVQTVQTNRNRKKVAPWVVALVFIVLFGAYIGFLIFAWMQTSDIGAAGLLFGIYIAVLAAMIIGIIIALRQRLKEIDGGEEDEALQY